MPGHGSIGRILGSIERFPRPGSRRKPAQREAWGSHEKQNDVKTASWVIREKKTGKVILETFDKRKVDALNVAKYEAVPILEYLGSLNSPRSN